MTNTVNSTTPEGTPGKITGGGSVDERIRNFGFIVQTKIQHGIMEFTGNLEFQDKNLNLNLHSESITLIRIEPDGIHGMFTGTATINQVSASQCESRQWTASCPVQRGQRAAILD